MRLVIRVAALSFVAAAVMVGCTQGASRSVDAPAGATTPQGTSVFVRPATERPDVLHVECDAQGDTLISGRAAFVQSDGIHLLVTNNTGAPVNLAVGTAAHFGLRTGAETEVVFGLAPGKWAVQCFEGEERPDPSGIRPIRFENRGGAWVAPNLECAGSAHTVSAGLTDRPPVDESPVAAARHVLWQLPTDAELQRAGYVESVEPLVRVLVGADTVGLLRFTRDQGRWAISASKCTGSGVHFTTSGF